MSKGKLAKFADMERFENVFQYPYSVVDDVPFKIENEIVQSHEYNDEYLKLVDKNGKLMYSIHRY